MSPKPFVDHTIQVKWMVMNHYYGAYNFGK